MQFRRRLLILSFATLLLATAWLNPSSKKVDPAQSAAFKHEAANKNCCQSTQFEGPEFGFDRERFEDISRVLSMIETGQTTLQLNNKYEIGVGFVPGNGSRFSPHKNEIVIDSNFGQYSAALLLIHEVTHARYFHERLAADITLHDRQMYVQMKMEEEMNAAVTSIEATIELSEAGVDISNLHSSLYYPYRQAYGSAFRAAKNDYPGLDDKTLQSIGRAAGQSVVLEAFVNGQVLTSINQQSYLAYWGSVWDVWNEKSEVRNGPSILRQLANWFMDQFIGVVSGTRSRPAIASDLLW